MTGLNVKYTKTFARKKNENIIFLFVKKIDMKLWIVNHYGTTPRSSGGTRHFDIAREVTKYKFDVTIWAAGRNYNTRTDSIEYGDGEQVHGESIDDVTFRWIKTRAYEGNISRLANMLQFSYLFLTDSKKQTPPDIVIGSTVHPFAAFAAALYSNKRDIPFVFEIRDLWPQTMIDLGIWKSWDPRSILFGWLERTTYNRATAIIALSPLTEGYLDDKYATSLGKKDVVLLPNFTDPQRFSNFAEDLDNSTFKEIEKLKKNGRKILLFAGSIVQSNDLIKLLDMAPELSKKEFDIVFVGGGQARQSVLSAGHPNVHLFDPVPKELVPSLLEAADVLLLTQGTVKWGSTNKAYDYLCSSNPILAVIDADHNVPYGKEYGVFRVFKENLEKLLLSIDAINKLSKTDCSLYNKKRKINIEKYHSVAVTAEKLTRFLRTVEAS